MPESEFDLPEGMTVRRWRSRRCRSNDVTGGAVATMADTFEHDRHTGRRGPASASAALSA